MNNLQMFGVSGLRFKAVPQPHAASQFGSDRMLQVCTAPARPPCRCRDTHIRTPASRNNTAQPTKNPPRRAARFRGTPRVGRATCSCPRSSRSSHQPGTRHSPNSEVWRNTVQHRREPRPGLQPRFRRLSRSLVRPYESLGSAMMATLLFGGGGRQREWVVCAVGGVRKR